MQIHVNSRATTWKHTSVTIKTNRRYRTQQQRKHFINSNEDRKGRTKNKGLKRKQDNETNINIITLKANELTVLKEAATESLNYCWLQDTFKI